MMHTFIRHIHRLHIIYLSMSMEESRSRKRAAPSTVPAQSAPAAQQLVNEQQSSDDDDDDNSQSESDSHDSDGDTARPIDSDASPSSRLGVALHQAAQCPAFREAVPYAHCVRDDLKRARLHMTDEVCVSMLMMMTMIVCFIH